MELQRQYTNDAQQQLLVTKDDQKQMVSYCVAQHSHCIVFDFLEQRKMLVEVVLMRIWAVQNTGQRRLNNRNIELLTSKYRCES